MMYAFYVLTLVLFVYLAPGLAFFPQLSASPLGLATVPVASVCIVGILCTLLLQLGMLNGLSVPIVSVGLALVAFFRVRQTRFAELKMSQLGWLLFVVMICLPYMAKLGTTGFDTADEIYSWNAWALQYYNGLKSPDFFNATVAPYPQLFPKLIAFCYHWCGSTELQLPVKAALIMISFSSISLLSWICPNKETNLARFILIVAILFGANLQKYIDHAYADPLMSAMLLASLGFFWSWQQTFQTRSLVICVMLAIGASYSKQPGFIWTLFSLPLLLNLSAPAEKRLQAKVATGVLLISSLLWLLGPGRGVADNGGVISASFSGRDYIEQLLFSLNTHLIHNPVVGLLFLWVSYKAISNSSVRLVYLCWLLPSLLAWILFGAYDLRLGMHTVLGMAFLVTVSGLPKWRWPERIVTAPRLLATGAILSTIFTGLVIQKSLPFQQNLNVYHSGQVTLAKYFGADANRIYMTLYDQKEFSLWSPTDYITGLFYTKSNIFRPNWVHFDDYNSLIVNDFTRQLLIDELAQAKVDVVFTAGVVANRGSIASRTLEVLASENPDIFLPFAMSENRYGYKTFLVNQSKLKQLQLAHQDD